MRPSVSICLPCLNTQPFLAECLRSIEAQSGVHWELIVCDGYSTDGSWEMLQEFCRSRANCTCFQSPASLYEAWNQCILKAAGRYIYIATSDDVLESGALQQMVGALDAHPDCGICQIRLAYIDQHSRPLPDPDQWENGRLTRYHPRFASHANKRFAPHDGVLMAGFHTVYESINQLLIRTEVFRRVGLFDPAFGSVGDFEWGMRVGLTENCIYLPQPTAYWRLHPAQATQPAFTASERLQALAMTRTAFRRASAISASSLPPALLHAMEDLIYDDYFTAAASRRPGLRGRLLLYGSEFRCRPALLVRRLFRVVRGATTTTFDYPSKLRRLAAVMGRFGIAAPRFL